MAQLSPVSPGSMTEAAHYRSGSSGNASKESAVSSTCAPHPSKVFMGMLKSMVPDRGYGFIDCKDSYAMFGRDVYVECSKFPDLSKVKVGGFVAFTIVLSPKGQPQAGNVAPRSPSAMAFF